MPRMWQDCFIKWSEADRAAIERLKAWLTTVCTRGAVSMCAPRRRSRVDYVGPWLPEPIQTAVPALEVSSPAR